MSVTVRKIFRNTTAGSLTILNRVVGAGESYEVAQRYWADVVDDETLQTYISDGDVVLSDGTTDLSTADALEWIKRWQLDSASDLLATDGQTVQESLDRKITTVLLTYNGTISNNRFIGYDNLLPGDNTPIVAPVTSDLKFFTWSNNRSEASFSLEFRKGSTSATPFYTWQTSSTLTAYVPLPSPQSFNAGDTLYIKYIDEGQNGRDAAILLGFT